MGWAFQDLYVDKHITMMSLFLELLSFRCYESHNSASCGCLLLIVRKSKV